MELNVTAIVIGALLSRIVYEWLTAFKYYAESKNYYDLDECERDREQFKRYIVSSIFTTAVYLFIVLIIVILYTEHIIEEENEEKE
jgi:hypothetical protein